MPLARAGLSFDTGASPEEARDLLASAGQPAAPADSWLRLRNMDNSFVRDSAGAEIPLWPAAKPEHSLAERRAALAQLQAQGFHLVALLRWNPESWPHGIRSEHPLRRLPIDLRDAFDRCRALAASYGDLIDYWEIDNEPDIGFVEENPETYAAFLKACYLGIVAGREFVKSSNFSPSPVSGGQSSDRVRSRVLMAPLALPPGPYFDAFLANRGLQYTDGFNYHYYGYAEDFTGVYEQFHAAILAGEERNQIPDAERQLANPISNTRNPSFFPATTDSILTTQFYPRPAGWERTELANFKYSAEASNRNRILLQARPLAVGEPRLTPQGRWLVSSGVAVEEIEDGWRFRISHLPAEPSRPAIAELPLSNGWKVDPNALLSFEYRITVESERRSNDQALKRTAGESSANENQINSPASTEHQFPISNSRLPAHSSSASLRSLPVFLTEYGYGLLDKAARNTDAGRARQRAWFEAVQPQIRNLGITHGMAFILKRYLENDSQEFGLLIKTEASPKDGSSMLIPAPVSPSGIRPRVAVVQPSDQPTIRSSFPPSLIWLPEFGTASPALEVLVADSRHSIAPQTWTSSAPLAPSVVVLDFVAGAGLQQAKVYSGYLARGAGTASDPAEGRLMLYNFGATTISGELRLQGNSWSFAEEKQPRILTLAPNERREIPVQIRPTTTHFEPQPNLALFHPTDYSPPSLSSTPAIQASAQSHGPVPGNPPPSSLPVPLPVRASAPLEAAFEPYFRLVSGSLYQTWPRLTATETWQRYNARLGNFTPAFFGRAQSPAAFLEHQPAALTFFFRPAQLPLIFEIRYARLIELSAP